jgi:hypothetical protein
MLRTKMLFVFLISSMLFTSCFDKEEDETVAPSWESFIAGSSQKAWVMTANTTNGENSLSELAACELDNEYVFYKSGQLEVTEGDSKCDESNEDLISTHSWTVSEESRQLFWDEEIYEVESISTTEMVLVFKGPDFEVKATLSAKE